jgi:hypothetical protein
MCVERGGNRERSVVHILVYILEAVIKLLRHTAMYLTDNPQPILWWR